MFSYFYGGNTEETPQNVSTLNKNNQSKSKESQETDK